MVIEGFRSFCLLQLLLLLCACSTPNHARDGFAGTPPILLENGWVVDPELAAEPVRADLLIRDGRIVEVGRQIAAGPTTKRVDVRGGYIVPGLWDMHAHLAVTSPLGNALEDYVSHGVLGVRDMGGRPAELLEIRRAVDAGERVGPTIYLAGPTLNGEASADHHRMISTPQDIWAAVEQLRAMEVDFIKIHRRVSREAFAELMEVARRAGLRVSGHVPLALKWDEAADAGMQTIEHIQALAENEIEPGADPAAATFVAVDRLEERRWSAILAALLRRGTYWTPTLAFFQHSWSEDLPERRLAKQRIYARLRPFVGAAAARGVPILAGTDMFENRGAALHAELQLLVEAGLTTRQALAAATTHPFSITGRGPGRIVPGAEASLLVVRRNPLRDIRNLRCIELILLRGVHQPAVACGRT
jgi:imidazolonepropionase-like amidohydrolase